MERDTKHIWLLDVVGEVVGVARSSLDGSQTGAQVHLIHPPPLCLVAIQQKEKGKNEKRAVRQAQSLEAASEVPHMLRSCFSGASHRLELVSQMQ